MTVPWSSLKPCLPCVDCRKVGHTTHADGLIYGCESCNGTGVRFCMMDDVRREYVRLRKIVSEERGIEKEDLDDMVKKRVERAERILGDVPPDIWFDALYYMARDFELLEKWWENARFGRK